MSLEPFKAHLLKKGYASRTVTACCYQVEGFLQWAEKHLPDPHFATYTDMLDYLKYLRKRNLSSRTIQAYFICIGHYFDYLIHCGAILSNPVRYLNIRNPRREYLYQILTKPQLEGLYHHFKVKQERLTRTSGLASAYRNKLAVGLMVFQGLDTYALTKLTTQDIDLDNGTIHLTANRKYNSRTLALQSAQIMDMYRYLHEIRPQLLGHFPQPDGQDLLLIHGAKRYADIHAYLIERLKKQQPAVTSAHQIRASVIVHWLQAYNLREVQYMAGHRNVTSTERYLRSDMESLQQDIDRFHPMA